jgi:O-antigen ligase
VAGALWKIALLVIPLALILGLAPVVLPWFVVIPALGVSLFVGAAWWRPEYAMAIMITVVSGLLPDFLLPRLPFFGGTLRAQDIFLLFLALICVFKHGGQVKRWWPGFQPFAAPLAALLLVVAFNVIYSKLILGNPTSGIIEELRPFVFFSLPLWLAMMVDRPAVLKRLMWALMAGATLLALAQIGQATSGLPIVHGGRLEEATIGRASIAGVVRSTVPGIYFIIFALLLMVARYLGGRQGLLVVAVLGALFTGALLFTFGRSLWGATAVGLFLVAWSFGGLQALRLLVVLALVGIMALGTLAVLKPRSAETMIDRALSVTEEGSSRTSLGWRIDENRMAWVHIRQRPLLGIGLGGSYKPVAYERGWEGESRITHNSHVFIQLKLGLIGAAALAWLLWTFWRQAGRLLQPLARNDLRRSLLVATRVLVPLVLITANIRPEWNEPATVAVLSLGIGLLVVLGNLGRLKPGQGQSRHPGPCPSAFVGVDGH